MAAKKKQTKVQTETSKEAKGTRHPLVSMAGTIGGVLVAIAVLSLIFASSSAAEIMRAVTIPLVIMGVLLGFFVYKKL